LIVSLVFLAAVPAAVAGIILSPPAGLAATAFCLAAVYTLNGRWLAYVGRRGPTMLVYAVAVLPAELAASLAGGGWGVFSYHLLGKRY